MRYEDDTEDPLRRAIDRHPGKRRDAEKRRGAREIVQRLEWLTFPIVYWTGEAPEINFCEAPAYRPLHLLIAERLSHLPPGLYAIEVEYPFDSDDEEDESDIRERINPDVKTVIRVTSKLVASSLRAWAGSKKYPRALPRVVDDVGSWRSRKKKNLERTAAALRCAPSADDIDVRALITEESCIWIGSEDLRPSQRLETERVAAWLEEFPEEKNYGRLLGAVLMGKRGKQQLVPRGMRKFARLGRRLANWPADLLCFAIREGLARWNTGAIPDFSLFNKQGVGRAVVERYFGNSSVTLKDFLSHFPTLLRAVDRLYEEPDRRVGKFMQALDKAIDISPAFKHTRLGSLDPERPGKRRWQFRRKFLEDFGRIISKRCIAAEAADYTCEDGFQIGALLVLGGTLPWWEGDWMRHRWGKLSDLHEKFQKQVYDLAQEEVSRPAWDWRNAITGLSGRK